MNTTQTKSRFLRLYLHCAALIAILSTAIFSSLLAAKPANTSAQIDQLFRDSVSQKKLAGIVAMAWRADKSIYQGAVGQQDAANNIPLTVDSIFRIASMTKPVTSVAVMQLVESGRVKLDEPISTYLPELSQLQVLEDFDSATGKAQLRPAKTVPTVRQLLTHTSGFAYDFFDPKLHSYVATGAVPSALKGGDGFLKAPLMFDPGSRWEYGISTDWLGKLVEKVSGQSLEDYFRQHIFEPLGMRDSFFNVPAEKQKRVAPLYQRRNDGTLQEVPPQPFTPVHFFSGGGGLYSTAGDYLKFMRMILNGGTLGKAHILKSETVALMTRNQIGDLTLVPMKSQAQQLAKDDARVPGNLEKFGLGFALNTKPVEGGRSAESLAWAGIFNTYFWIDPAQKTCGVIMMQVLPFSDQAATSVFEQFEHAVYADVDKASAHK